MASKIYFITQAKGGSGKSVLAFLLAEKYKEAFILDLDDATTTTMQQLAYRNPLHVSFLDPKTKRIDRGAFNALFESVMEEQDQSFIADLGASVAEQLPKYFMANNVEAIQLTLTKKNVQLQLVCVVGGGNIFKATMVYLNELVKSVKGLFKIVVAHNGIYPLSEQQEKDMKTYIANHQLSFIEFDLVSDKGEMVMRTIEDVLKDGKGIAGLSPFTSIYFQTAIDELEL